MINIIIPFSTKQNLNNKNIANKMKILCEKWVKLT